MTRTWDRRVFIDLMLRVPLFLSVAPAGLVACRPARPGTFTPHHRATLKRVAYLMFPYAELGDEPYERTVAGIADLVARQSDLASLVVDGVLRLDGGKPGAWLALAESEQTARLREIETGPFFRWLYQATIDRLFNDPQVWSHVGYEGSSFEKGGYLKRGFDDIDWL